jgi:hypothetical protein
VVSIKPIAVLALAVTGLVLTVWSIWSLHQELETIRTWVPVPASVTRSWVEEHHGDERDYAGYTVGYEFAFNYGGEDHHAKTFSPNIHSRSGADTLVSTHYVGSTATIRVNPANPDDVNPNLDRNPATLAGSLWLVLGSMTLVLVALPLWLLAKPQDLW